MRDDLASGFKNVDEAAQFGVFSSCLTLVESLPFFAAIKQECSWLLEPGPGRLILDVGCGLGNDAAAVAGMGATVVGVDRSQAMVDAARARHAALGSLSFEVADAERLPFPDAHFDACRVDRVLQHLADPGRAIAEMARVLKPGGILVAYDNDWETLTVDAPDRPLTRTILNAWCDRFPSGWIGRQMVALCLRAGLSDAVASPRTLVLRELDTSDRLYCFFATVDGLITSGAIDRDAGERWSASLRQAESEGRFFTSYTGFLVTARRPRA